MEFVQQEIDSHKTKLMNLINNLINTTLINQEIYINNEIKKESEFLNSLLNIKQNSLINPMNNNINFNPFVFQPNIMNNGAQINIIPNQFGYQPIIQNNFNYNFESNNNKEKNIKKINVNFRHILGKETLLICKVNEIISEVIVRYREKSNDYNVNNFLFNGQKLDEYSFSTLQEQGIVDGNVIIVESTGNLKGGNFII